MSKTAGYEPQLHSAKMRYKCMFLFDDCAMTKGLFHGCLGLMAVYIAFGLLFALCLFSGCSEPKTVVVEKLRTEYISTSDTIREKDTVQVERETVVREARPEDSAMLAKLGIRLRENERMLILLQRELDKARHETYESHNDTAIKADSVRVPVPVERKLTKWETFCLDYGKVTTGMSVAFVAIAVVWLVRRIGKKRKVF